MIPTAAEHREFLNSNQEKFKNKIIGAVDGGFRTIRTNTLPHSSVVINLEEILDCYPYNGDDYNKVDALLTPKTNVGNQLVYKKIKPDTFMIEVIEYILSLGYNVELEGKFMYVKLEDTKI